MLSGSNGSGSQAALLTKLVNSFFTEAFLTDTTVHNNALFFQTVEKKKKKKKETKRIHKVSLLVSQWTYKFRFMPISF